MANTLTPLERRDLSARAHHLDPVVTVGQKGLTESVLREIDRALTAHELVKVRVDGDDRAARVTRLDEICARTGASAVKQVGKVLILWRARPLETT